MSHSHHHHHGHAHDYAAANKAHFDDRAHEYKEIPGAQEACDKTAKAILKAYPFDKETTTLMDYACGPGLVTLQLAPYTKSTLGVDVSQGMINEFQDNAAKTTSPENIKGIVRDLLSTRDDLDGQKFDVIICSAAYHHFSSTESATQVLASYLKPGGALFVSEFQKFPTPKMSEEEKKNIQGVVAHQKGFTKEEFERLFEGAGLTDISFQPPIEVKLYDSDAEILLAMGVKPVS